MNDDLGGEAYAADELQALMNLRLQLADSNYYSSYEVPKSSAGVAAVLSALPILTRDKLKVFWRDLCSSQALKRAAGKFIKVTSSGTTGEPVTVIKDDYDCVHMWTVLKYWFEVAGLERPHSTRCLLLDGLPNQIERSSRIPLLENGLFERINVRAGNAVARIHSFSPHVIFTDPSGLQWLNDYAELLKIQPRMLLSSAQHLPLLLLESVSKSFGAVVFDYYATTETGPIAWRCLKEPGHWHVLESEHWFEIDRGSLVVTRKRQSLFPLVRYRTGDSAEFGAEFCACGRSGKMLKNFEGREACVFVREDGSKLDAWALSPLLKYRIQNRFQLTQLECSKFLLSVERIELQSETTAVIQD
ncbi:MAG: hypothetical protein EOP05_19795, partial [Proteobacteria bacterium]